jgi:hypothetical protein
MKKKWLGRIKHTKVKWLVPSLTSVEENNPHVLIAINRLMTDNIFESILHMYNSINVHAASEKEIVRCVS